MTLTDDAPRSLCGRPQAGGSAMQRSLRRAPSPQVLRCPPTVSERGSPVPLFCHVPEGNLMRQHRAYDVLHCIVGLLRERRVG
jgi:hypothetical protein